MDKYCPDGQSCESSGCSGIRCHRFELHATSDIRTYPYTEPCPHCAAKDAEIAALLERVGSVERKLAEVQRLHDGVWSCENAAHTAQYFNEGLKRILRGEADRD